MASDPFRVAGARMRLLRAVAVLVVAHGAGLAARSAAEAPDSAVRPGCELARSIASSAPGASIERSDGVFAHELLPGSVRGCRVVITRSAGLAPSGQDVAGRLYDGFSSHGWQEMPAYTADGVDGTAFVLRKGEVACLFQGIWDGDPDGEPSRPGTCRVSVLCTTAVPPEERLP